ncbi:hypothetical protein Tco_1437446 [Tanacetum coccineum]
MLIVMVMIVFAIKSQQQQQVNEDYGICGLSGLICVLVFRSPLKADDWIDMILILLHDDRVQYSDLDVGWYYPKYGCVYMGKESGMIYLLKERLTSYAWTWIDSIYVLPTMIKDKLVLLSWKVTAANYICDKRAKY